jgi:hypothetical protein
MVADVHPIWLAQSKLRRRRYDECIQLCTAALQTNPLDQASIRDLRKALPAAANSWTLNVHVPEA